MQKYEKLYSQLNGYAEKNEQVTFRNVWIYFGIQMKFVYTCDKTYCKSHVHMHMSSYQMFCLFSLYKSYQWINNQVLSIKGLV